MAHPKLFTLVDAIDLKQVNTLRKYILSKVSEQSEAYQILETIIKTKDKREKYHDAESMQLAFYPKIKIKTFINYLSLLYSYAEDWIALAQMEIDEHSKDLLVQKWLNSNALYSLSDQLVKKVLKKIETSEGLDINDAKVKSELFFEHLMSTNPIKYEFNTDDFLEMIMSLDEYYSSQQIFILTEFENWKSKLKINFDEKLMPIEEKLRITPKSEIFEIVKLTYNLVKNEDLTAFNLLKESLLNNSVRTKSRFHYALAHFLYSKSVSLRAKGLPVDTNTIYEIAKYGLEKGVFFSNGKLPIITFHNIVSRLAVSLSFEEICLFIENWISKVNTINPEATISLAMAQNCFQFQKFNEMYNYAWRGDFEIFSQKLTAQFLLVISTFMNRKKDDELYKSTYRLTSSFLERNKQKISTHAYLSYYNLLMLMKNVDKVGPQNIDISEYKPLIYINWCNYLIEKGNQ